MKRISRFEIIDQDGRVSVYYGSMLTDFQDGDRTLKIFIEKVEE